MNRIQRSVAYTAVMALSLVIAGTAAAAPRAAPPGAGSGTARAVSVVPPQPATATSPADEAAFTANAALLPAALSPGLYYPGQGTTPVIRTYRDAPHVTITARSSRPDVKTVPSQFTAGELAQVAAQLPRVPISAAHSLGGYYDAALDVFSLEGSVPPAIIARSFKPGTYAYTYVPDARSGRVKRANDSAPHTGGSKLRNTTLGTGCSSGVTVFTSGAKRMVTAAHCGKLFNSFTSFNGGHDYGAMLHRAPFPASDLALLSGSTYEGTVYYTNTVKYPVVSAANPAVGSSYCFSGGYGGKKCGAHVSSLTASFCDQQGCTSPVIKFSGVAPVSGDSGSPLWMWSGSGAATKILVRGIVFANIGTIGGYAEPWTRIVSRFGASIVTG